MDSNLHSMPVDQAGLNLITEEIIGCAFQVANQLGCGFLEKVYENAMVIAMRKAGLRVEQQHEFTVEYEGESVGHFVADLLVEGSVLVALKAVKEFDDVHFAQCINYLRATGLPVCLLINFGKTKVKLKRFVNLRREAREGAVVEEP